MNKFVHINLNWQGLAVGCIFSNFEIYEKEIPLMYFGSVYERKKKWTSQGKKKLQELHKITMSM